MKNLKEAIAKAKKTEASTIDGHQELLNILKGNDTGDVLMYISNVIDSAADSTPSQLKDTQVIFRKAARNLVRVAGELRGKGVAEYLR